MRPRFTAFVLTMLLSMAAGVGVPATSTAIPGVSYSVVWPNKSHQQTPKQEISESREAVQPLPANSLPVIPKNEALAPAALLDPSLFQRPPPSADSRP